MCCIAHKTQNMTGSRLSKSCADYGCAPFAGFCEKNHLTVGVFSQPLRNFTQRFSGEARRGCKSFHFSIRHMCCLFTQRVNPSSSDWSSGLLLKRADSGRTGGSNDGER